MKFLLSFLAIILLCACRENAEKGAPAKAGFGYWTIRDSTVLANTYTAKGLLGSTLKTWYHYHNGRPDVSLTSLITREYNPQGLLTEVRYYDYLDGSKKGRLTGKEIKTYDGKGNLVLNVTLDIKKNKSTVSRLEKSLYDQNNQEVVRLEIFEQIGSYDEKTPSYDTAVIKFSYDKEGNLVTETYGTPAQQTRQVLSSVFSHGVKTATVSTDIHGDTNIVYTYVQEGGWLRETSYHANDPRSQNIDTVWYKGNKEVKRVHYDARSHQKNMQRCWYDRKDNEIREVNYN